jgi:hypothetical protein
MEGKNNEVSHCNWQLTFVRRQSFTLLYHEERRRLRMNDCKFYPDEPPDGQLQLIMRPKIVNVLTSILLPR